MLEIRCDHQNYDWGNIGQSSKVFQLLPKRDGVTYDESLPYAEFWLGDYQVKGSVVLHKDASEESLYSYIQRHKEAFLGKSSEFDCLPFLLKVLSVNKALSIQAHPDKELAKKLHAEQPTVYKDPNHKPEMTIALTDFSCLCGFRSLAEIKGFLETVPELGSIIGSQAVSSFLDFLSTEHKNDSDDSSKKALAGLFRALMTKSKSVDELKAATTSLISRIASSDSDLDKTIKQVYSDYGADIGVFCIFFLNVLRLKPGDGVFLAANEPHAYLKGDCVECMARSDNVVRAGLTPKLIDVDTLASMLTYRAGLPQLLQPAEQTNWTSRAVYRAFHPPIPEFYLVQISFPEAAVACQFPRTDGPAVLLVVSGTGTVRCEDAKYSIGAGSTYFVHPEQSLEMMSTTSDLLAYLAVHKISS